jgi:tRNA-guanine family transglycosylase
LVRDAPHLETVFCARDYPLFAGSLNANHKDYCITQTIAYAYEFKALTGGALPPHWRTMAIVQGYDANSLIFCANELKQIGFDFYGIGSLAMLRRHEPIMERVRAVASVLAPERLHIFGVSVISAAREMRALGIRSIDSSRPAKTAAYNEVLYSHPYRHYGILASTTPARFPKSRLLAAPLPCTCPVCRRGGNILGTGKREFIRDRATHNYYHLKRAVLTE